MGVSRAGLYKLSRNLVRTISGTPSTISRLPRIGSKKPASVIALINQHSETAIIDPGDTQEARKGMGRV